MRLIKTPEPNAATDARLGMRYAILSACWGAIPQVMVKDSSVIIIFASLLGASEMVAVLSTSLQDLALGLLMLPLAALSDRMGVKRQICIAILIGMTVLLMTAASPWAGRYAGVVLMLALSFFAVAMAAYTSAWLPLLERVVPPAERGLFFGRMRFSWQLVAALFIFGSAWFLGRYASVGRLQVVITMAALAGLGRIWYIYRIPLKPLPAAESQGRPLLTSVLTALSNRELTGFGVYLFFLYAAANGTIPVVFVFARNYLKLADSLIVTLSGLMMGGLIAGFLFGGRFVNRYGCKGVFLGSHIGFACLNFLLLFVHDAQIWSVAGLMLIVVCYGFLVACASIAVSSELLALAQPANKAVSIALGYTLYTGGMAVSRVAASLVLGSGILATQWGIGGVVFTRYHSLFLCSGIGVLAAMFLLLLLPGMVRDVNRYPAV